MENNFDTFPDRRKTDSIKWRRYPEDIIPMWVADMDFVSPEPVIHALRERVEHGIFGYPDSISPNPTMTAGLRQVIMARLADRYQWHVLPEDLVFTSGVVYGFNQACHAFGAPGDGVLVQTPVYTPILEAHRRANLAHQEMELTRDPDGSYSIDWQAYQEAIDERTRLFILCNPHNPVGKAFTKTELEKMAEICLRRKMLIISDEIHCDLVYTGHQHTPIAALDPEIAQNSITLFAPSKTFNLAGLQCSIAIIQNPELRKKYLRSGKGLAAWVNLMGVVAAQAAYQEGQEWLDQLLVYLEGNRDFLYDYVYTRLPGIQMGKPEATFLAWLDCRQARIEGNPYDFFLERARVALVDGPVYGKSGEGFVRLNFGCPRAILEEALGRMRKALLNI